MAEISAGYDGIINAIKKYDESIGSPLYSFAKVCAYRQILKELNSQKLQRQRYFSISEYQNLCERYYKQTNSQKAYPDSFEAEGSLLSALWCSDEMDELVESDYNKLMIKRALCIINKMPVKRRDIMIRYINGQSFAEIATHYHISRQCVERTIKDAKKYITIDKLDNQYNEV